MHVNRRALVGAFWTSLGLVFVLFNYLQFAITDCSDECVDRGERAVPLLLGGIGVGLMVAGFLYRRGTYRAVAWGFMAGGLVAALAIGWIMFDERSRGIATWLLLGSIVVAAIGAWMRFVAARDGGPP